MRLRVVTLAMLSILAALAVARPAAACGVEPLLELGVRDLNDTPVARIAFDVEVDGALQSLVTDGNGLAKLSCATAKTARIAAARSAAGQPLTMDENTKGGGLTIPLTEGQTVRLPLRLSDSILFVEPIAEGQQSVAFGATPASIAPSAAALPAAGGASPGVSLTPPIPTPSPRAWLWWVGALMIALPAPFGLYVWLQSTAARRSRQ